MKQLEIQPLDIVSGTGGNYLILDIQYHKSGSTMPYYSFKVMNEQYRVMTLLGIEHFYKKVGRLSEMRRTINNSDTEWKVYEIVCKAMNVEIG